MQLSWLRTVNKVLPKVKTANTVAEKDMESPPAEMSKNVLDAARRATSSNSARAKRGRTRSELTAKRPD